MQLFYMAAPPWTGPSCLLPELPFAPGPLARAELPVGAPARPLLEEHGRAAAEAVVEGLAHLGAQRRAHCRTGEGNIFNLLIIFNIILFLSCAIVLSCQAKQEIGIGDTEPDTNLRIAEPPEVSLLCEISIF